jgi:diguanylate cyclase (GGDEF)-like protein
MWLDVKTMLVTNAALLLIGAAAAYTIWHRQRALDGLLWWARGTSLAALGTLLAAWIGPTPPSPIGPAAATMMVCGVAMTWTSMRRFNGKTDGLRFLVPCMLAFVVTLAACISLDVPFIQRAGLISFAVSGFAALAAWEAWHDEGPQPLRSRFVMSAVFAVTAALLFARAGLAFLFPSTSSAATFYDPLKGVVPLMVSVTIVCFNLVIMMMASERLSRGAQRLALTDDLTGLPNRRSLLEQAGRLARSAERGAPAAILMMDLDHFAEVNKRHGHVGGDKALVTFAGLLRQYLRATDVVARYGGEEFCAFLPRTELPEAARFADRLRAALAGQNIDVNGETFRVTVSIGVAAFKGGDLQASFRQADAALYRAKACGRDRVISDTSHFDIRRRLHGGVSAIAGGEGAVSI